MRKHNPIYKRALMLAVPMMIQNGITNMVSLVDNIMVGSQGTEAMTAVSIAGQLIFVFNLAIFGALAGPGIYGAQYYGQRNMHGFQSTFRIKLWLSLTCLIGGLLVFLLRDESLIGLYLHGESATVDSALTMTYAKQYLHRVQVADMHTAETSLDYYGVYKGTVPAADCPGIELTLTLKKDRTYTYHWAYIDRKDADFDETGTFTVKDNLLTLTEKGGEVSYFKVQEGSLVMLNNEKQPATGALADAYVLKQEEVFLD